MRNSRPPRPPTPRLSFCMRCTAELRAAAGRARVVRGQRRTGRQRGRRIQWRRRRRQSRSSLGQTIGSGLFHAAGRAVEQLYDDVSLAVASSLADNPLAAALGHRGPARVAEPVRVAVRHAPIEAPAREALDSA